ncbi:hypothetical protein JKP88DRAFT_329698 [Tribonema minus]|uniref:Retinol dehydrogenase 12 n=1 Tax=Tribonema minus TaxID=303371 RepID=A0A835YP27_9STRA|nr:hypothetical protein JKP88DRAFT_329698 [Tribonema minus]
MRLLLLLSSVALLATAAFSFRLPVSMSGRTQPSTMAQTDLTQPSTVASKAQAKSEHLPSSPWPLATDSTVASAWQAVSLPPTLAARVIGLAQPQRLPRPNLTGRIAVVSGANTGIGRKTAEHLAETGVTLIMACRSKERGEQAMADMERSFSRRGIKTNIEVMQLDLLEPASIRAFARDFKQKYDALHILVNNAGTNIPGITDRGLDYVFTVSYLGHFMLTNLLYDTIKATPDARVVNVSSLLHRYGTTQWAAAATGKRGSDNYFNALFHVYCDSKLAMMIFTQSDIWRAVPLWLRIPLDLFMRVAFLSTEQGCHTSVMAALAPLEALSTDGEPALYLQPYKGPVQKRPFDVIGPFGGTVPTTASLPADVKAEGERLWDTSAKIWEAAEAGTLRTV